MRKLKNIATSTGIHNNINTVLNSNENEVLLINNFEFIKKSNKKLWATGNLTYTIVIKNLSSASFNNIIIKDVLNPNFILLDVQSVRINDIPAGYGIFTYKKSNGLLLITLPRVKVKEKVVITFKVNKRNAEVFTLKNVATLSLDECFNDVFHSNFVTTTATTSACKCNEIQENIKHKK